MHLVYVSWGRKGGKDQGEASVQNLQSIVNYYFPHAVSFPVKIAQFDPMRRHPSCVFIFLTSTQSSVATRRTPSPPSSPKKQKKKGKKKKNTRTNSPFGRTRISTGFTSPMQDTQTIGVNKFGDPEVGEIEAFARQSGHCGRMGRQVMMTIMQTFRRESSIASIERLKYNCNDAN